MYWTNQYALFHLHQLGIKRKYSETAFAFATRVDALLKTNYTDFINEFTIMKYSKPSLLNDAKAYDANFLQKFKKEANQHFIFNEHLKANFGILRALKFIGSKSV